MVEVGSCCLEILHDRNRQVNFSFFRGQYDPNHYPGSEVLHCQALHALP